jgi:hypothetical protein
LIGVQAGNGRVIVTEVLPRDPQGHVRSYRPVCLGTADNVGRPDLGRGGSGEHVARGVVGPHAYAVLDCIEGPGGTSYVQVHNPWGDTGRAAGGATRIIPRRRPLRRGR